LKVLDQMKLNRRKFGTFWLFDCSSFSKMFE